jgi:WD40 repeat protein
LATFYDILGVEPQAEPSLLRKAYRKLARRYHPDVNPDPRSHDMMARINDAFSTLIDPTRRSEYDAMLAGGFGRAKTATVPKEPMTVRLVRRLGAHRTPVYAVAFSPETGGMISSSFDNEIIWWDAGGQAPLRRAKVDNGVISTVRAFPGDLLIAAGAVENHLTMWRIENGSVHTFKSSEAEWVSCLAISANGSSIATGSVSRAFAVTKIDSGDTLFQRHDHEESVTAVAWSADGKVVATGSADNSVKLWNGQTGELIHTFKAVRSAVTAIAFSSDDRFLAVAAVDLSIRVFSLSDGTLQKMMFGHTKPIETLAFHKNGWLFASGGRDGAVKLWNADKGVGQLHIEASSKPILSVGFSPDGKFLAAGGLDRQIRIWELTARNE